MTEFCFPNTINNKNKKIKPSDIAIVCSYILSHPIYFSYLIFFSPYLFKFFSFLSPLFFTTFLLFLSLITTLIPLHPFIINSKDDFFLTAYTTVIEHFRPSFDDDDNDENSLVIEGFEVYKVVFDVPEIELSEANPVEEEEFGENPVAKLCQLEERIVNQCAILTLEQETGDTSPRKVEEKREKKQEEIVKRSESKVKEVKKTPKFGSLRVNNDEKFSDAFPQTVGEQQCLGSFGSMRKEKEWRRTLACKLFEERHNWSNNKINVSGEDVEECMDLLWETTETETNKGKLKEEEEEEEEKDKKGGRKEDKIENLMKNESGEGSEEYDEYDTGKMCCLQALKFSAGKMNLSMGSPNLVKFSKAFKGIGWLQKHVRRQGKKGYK